MKYDAVIIGAGPAGIFAAAELVKSGKKVLIVDKGRLIKERVCPILAGKVKACVNCNSCAVVSGWGGAGSASDGKLTLTTGFGGNLEEYIGREELENLIKYVDDKFVEFGADPNFYEADGKLAREIICSGAKAGLRVIPAKIRHIGTDASREVLNNMYEDLNSKCDILMNTQVKDILIENDTAVGVILDNGEIIKADKILAS
ncbi:MAG: NAD(P)/FAD-dependent oxidoreductase, partial [Synergistaceae bacterium]|nr:NAD(P)/FAD-dependent oxidoreductase [Synergistaceae bacterium]